MSNRVVLVTGSAKRLGKFILHGFHKVGGFNLVLNYRSSEIEANAVADKIRKEGGKVITVKGDVSKREDVINIMKRIEESFGRLDVLVNNAAIFPKKRWNEITDEDWDEVMNINLKSSFLCIQEGAKVIKRTSGRGNIINMASTGGYQSWVNHIHYCASKTGVISLTKSFAKALAPEIVVNGIAPGTIYVEGEESDEIEHIDREKIPLKRYGKPEDIVDTVLHLSKENIYITGVTIPVDGGQLL